MHGSALWLDLSLFNEEKARNFCSKWCVFSSPKHNAIIFKAAKGSQRPPMPLNLGGFPSHTVLPNFLFCSEIKHFLNNFYRVLCSRETWCFSATKNSNYKIQCSLWKERNRHYNISLCFPFPFPSLSLSSLLSSPLHKPLLNTLLLYLTTVMNC